MNLGKRYMEFFFFFGCAGSSLLRGLFSSLGEWELLFIEVLGLLIAVASCSGAQALGH